MFVLVGRFVLRQSAVWSMWRHVSNGSDSWCAWDAVVSFVVHAADCFDAGAAERARQRVRVKVLVVTALSSWRPRLGRRASV